MNILIDIGHPAHVHYFRNLYKELSLTNNILITCKSIPIIELLLQHYNVQYIGLGVKGDGIVSKLAKQVKFTNQVHRIIKERCIELAIGVSTTILHATKLTQAHSILFDDDDQEVQPFNAKFGTPFADTIVSPNTLQFEQLGRAVYYPGYHELAYLHPKRFSPDPAVLEKYGINAKKSYSILRFNAFKAHHDIKEMGMSILQKRTLVRELLEYGNVFITTEAGLDPEFEQYKLPIKPHEMHDFLFYAKALVSDSQTMSSEAAMLGVPSFRCNTFVGRISYLEEEEKRYGLTYGFRPHQFDWMLSCIKKTLSRPNLDSDWICRRNAMLKDKIDVTAFWVWFIDNYPESIRKVREMAFNFSEFK